MANARTGDGPIANIIPIGKKPKVHKSRVQQRQIWRGTLYLYLFGVGTLRLAPG